MYAGDFVTAEEWASRVLEQSPTAYRAYLPRAMAALSRGDIPAAREVYAQMAKTDPQGGSLASMGLADLLIYSGALAEAETELKRGIAADRAIKSPAAVAAKSLAMAEALFARQQSRAATVAVEQALDANRDESTLVAAARLQVALGHTTAAREIVAVLDKRLPLQPRAYARLIEGEIAAREGRFAQAVEAFGAALKLADLWLARFALGVAYVQAEAYAEGLRELEISEKRRGEATAVFLDDVPSYRYLATLPYWLGRAQEGVGQQTAAADNFRKFLALRSSVPGDALAADARKRLQ
jgi:tetratricopeptide (TPR) repeat protein